MPVFITRKGLEIACLFEPDKDAPLVAEHFERLNYEGFFFCDPAERTRFLADPLAFCGLLTDPVSKLRFRPDEDSPQATHEGVVFYFEDHVTARIFERMPEDYALPGYKMEDGGPEDEQQVEG